MQIQPQFLCPKRLFGEAVCAVVYEDDHEEKNLAGSR